MSIYDEIAAERQRAHEIHGPTSIESWSPTSEARLAILLEEVGEVAREFNEARHRDSELDVIKLRAELIQTAACAAAWADALGDAIDLWSDDE